VLYFTLIYYTLVLLIPVAAFNNKKAVLSQRRPRDAPYI